MGHYLELAKEAIREVEQKKAVNPTKTASKAELGAALKRLECGETSVIRMYSHTCKGQFLVLADDVIPESIIVNGPSFTLAELKRLIGSDTEHIRAVYQLKKVFGAKVIEHG